MNEMSRRPYPSPVSAAPQAGADLRMARERLNWPLPDVAAMLRIRQPHLEALEDGDLARLPGNAFALGFLRSYANALGLDAEEMLRRFKAEAAQVSLQTELSFPAPVPDRGLPMGAVILLGVVLAVGAYVGWYRLSGEGRLPAETAAAVPERLASLADQALPPAVVPQVRPEIPAEVAEPPQPLSALSPSSAAAAPVKPLAVPAPPPSSAAAAPVKPLAVLAPPPAGVAVTSDQPRLMLRATADAWVQVRDKTGTVILNKVLKPGETWTVPRTGLLLTTGNAAATEVLLDGVVSTTLGGAGAVRRDLPLEVDAVKDGKLAAIATPRTTQ